MVGSLSFLSLTAGSLALSSVGAAAPGARKVRARVGGGRAPA